MTKSIVNDKRLILASGSPRRAELLQQLQLSFVQFSQDMDESYRAGETIADYAERMAKEKAQAAWQALQAGAYADCGVEDTVILSADTCGECDGELLGKPDDSADAERLLRKLSGRCHTIHSAFALFDGEQLHVENVRSQVQFRALCAEEIQRYWRTGEPCDKAGAYAIQGIGAQFVAHLSGSYSAVMGLPLFELSCALPAFGIRTL